MQALRNEPTPAVSILPLRSEDEEAGHESTDPERSLLGNLVSAVATRERVSGHPPPEQVATTAGHTRSQGAESAGRHSQGLLQGLQGSADVLDDLIYLGIVDESEEARMPSSSAAHKCITFMSAADHVSACKSQVVGESDEPGGLDPGEAAAGKGHAGGQQPASHRPEGIKQESSQEGQPSFGSSRYQDEPEDHTPARPATAKCRKTSPQPFGLEERARQRPKSALQVTPSDTCFAHARRKAPPLPQPCPAAL